MPEKACELISNILLSTNKSLIKQLQSLDFENSLNKRLKKCSCRFAMRCRMQFGEDSREYLKAIKVAMPNKGRPEEFKSCCNPSCSKAENKDVKLQVCGQCKVTLYCSRTCQKQHWPSHKSHCSEK